MGYRIEVVEGQGRLRGVGSHRKTLACNRTLFGLPLPFGVRCNGCHDHLVHAIAVHVDF